MLLVKVHTASSMCGVVGLIPSSARLFVLKRIETLYGWPQTPFEKAPGLYHTFEQLGVVFLLI